MPPFKEMVGLKFGRFLVLERLDYSESSHTFRFLCRCECGIEKVLRGSDLRSGNTKSCGCLRREVLSQRPNAAKKHGLWKTREFQVWTSMRQRCNNPKHQAYRYYGGRGIKVCDRWNKSFIAFLEDMGARPLGQLSIDRINNDGNYEPDNCRWTTMREQRRNTSANIRITFNGETKTRVEWCELLNIPLATMDYWLHTNKDIPSMLARRKGMISY